jgi:putative integral membrane protein (TIGR02587 family)
MVKRAATPRITASAFDRDCILRAFAGALLGALPLLYTMEMWTLGRTMSPDLLLVLLLVTVVLVALGLLYGGFRRGPVSYLGLDVLIVFGVAIVTSALTLLVVGQVHPGRMALPVNIRVIAIETIPCAIGASLAITQLRPRRHRELVDRHILALPQDVQKVLATIVGGVFFAFNIAPTDEVRKMTVEADPRLLPLVLLFSIGASYLFVFLADFAERPPHYHEGWLGNPVAETFTSYIISLAVSLGFLYAFGHVDGSTPVNVQLAMMVVLGYVTTIGGAAGRVLVAETV